MTDGQILMQQDDRQWQELEEEQSLYAAADRLVDHFVTLGRPRELAIREVYDFVGLR